MTPLALDVLFASLAGGGSVLLAGLRGWRTSTRRRRAERERIARITARWEPRTQYRKGKALVDVVRVARWDGQEVITELDTDGPWPVTVAAGDDDKRIEVEASAWMRADDLNTELN